jgi:hypothetical protein
MRHFDVLAIGLGLVAVYFSTAYFAVAALYPLSWALTAGLVAAILAYLPLVLTERDTLFLVTLLFVLPFSCFVVGMIWWILRLMGLFVIRQR